LGPGALKYYDALPEAYAFDQGLQDRLDDMAQRIQKCQRPVLICGTDIVPESTPLIAADLALLIRAMEKRAGLFYILPGPNAFGAGLLSPTEEPAPLIAAMERGDIRALLLLECDPFQLFPDHQRLAKALDKLDLLLVVDYLPSQSVEQARIVLPATTLFEGKASSFVNQEGRLQVAYPVHAGGVPIAQISKDKHPPRTFLHDVPGGDPRAPSDILSALFSAHSGQSERMSGDDLWTWLSGEAPNFKGIFSADRPEEGLRLIPDDRSEEDFRATGTVPLKGEGIPDDHLELLLVDRIFGTEELSGYSRVINQVEKPPQVNMHRDDAGRLGLSDGMKVSINLEGASLELKINVSENMAPGVMILPRLRQLDWPGMANWRMFVPMKAIKGVE
jgi:NADH-quinone oxidoreductase subunit G